jgi:hypothetical protein
VSEARKNSGVISGSAVLAGGIASAAAAAITSKFGVGGTIGGAAITSMIIITVSSILKAHFEAASSKVRRLGSGFQTKNVRRPGGFRPLRGVDRLGDALRWFSLMPGYRKRPILVRILAAAVLTFVVGLAIITATEASFGKTLSCKIWGDCPTVATYGGTAGKATSTNLSIFGGGAKPSSGTVTSSGTSAAPSSQQSQQPGVQQQATPSSAPSNAQSAPANGSQQNSGQPSGKQNVQSAAPSGGNQQSAAPSGGGQQAVPSGGGGQVPGQQAVPGGQGAVPVPSGSAAGNQ